MYCKLLSQHKNRSDFLCLQIKLFLSGQKIMIYFPLSSMENNEKLCQFSHIVNCLLTAKKWIYLHRLSKPSFSIRFGFDLCSWLIQFFSFLFGHQFGLNPRFGPIQFNKWSDWPNDIDFIFISRIYNLVILICIGSA